LIGDPYQTAKRALIDFSLMKPKKPETTIADAVER
jgi:heptose-I-phosphate ethanolaminephosphotransferase